MEELQKTYFWQVLMGLLFTGYGVAIVVLYLMVRKLTKYTKHIARRTGQPQSMKEAESDVATETESGA